MTRSTNKKILIFSLLPMAAFGIFTYLFPVVLKGTQEPNLLNYIAIFLWWIGCFGAFFWFTAGVMSHLVTWALDTMEWEREELNIKGDYYDFKIQTMRMLAKCGLYVEYY